jgi:hypothetical protein
MNADLKLTIPFSCVASAPWACNTRAAPSLDALFTTIANKRSAISFSQRRGTKLPEKIMDAEVFTVGTAPVTVLRPA